MAISAASPFESTSMKYHEESFRLRIKESIDVEKIFNSLDANQETIGAGVIFVDSQYTVVKLRPFKPICHNKPINIIFRELPPEIPPKQFAADVVKTERRESKLLGEVIGAAASCTSAALAWVVVVGSTATIPITGPAGATLTYLGYAAATASTVQCAVGAGRIGLETFASEGLDWLDSQEWYTTTMTALDVISLAGVAGTASATIKMILSLRATTGRGISEILKGLTRHERARLTREIARLNHPNISNKAYKNLIKAGLTPRRYSNEQITKAIMLQVKDSIGASFGFFGSAYSGVAKSAGSAAGFWAIAIYEELSIGE